MHVGLLIYGSLDTVSGGYLYDRMLVEHLRLSGDTVELISLPWRSYPHHLADNFSRKLHHRLAGFQGDLLIQDELNHPSLFLLNRRMRSQINYPLLSIVHHLRSRELRAVWQNRLYSLIERFYLQTIDGFVFNSQTTRQTVLEAGVNLQANSHKAIPHIVAAPAGDQFDPKIEPAEIIQRAKLPGALRIAFIANLIPRKGLHSLLEALALPPAESCSLTVIGRLDVDPAYTRRIRRQIEKRGLGARLRLLGSLPVDRLAVELRSHHVLAVPSTYEGYGIAYLEGMSFGLPAIAAAGAASEIITSGRNGFLVPPGDPPALAQRLGELAGDRLLLAEMGLAALRRFEAQPTWHETCAAIRQFLLSVSTGRQSARISDRLAIL
jgi:glycosyltransferase involved in cell wall biosynthesis